MACGWCPAGPTEETTLKRVLTATVRGAGKAPASVLSTGSLAPRKADLGRADPILIPRGGPRPWRSYQRSARTCFPRIAPVACRTMYRWKPLVPMMCGPNVDQPWVARGGSGAPRGGPWLARETPAGCPDKRVPPGDRLVRGSPGGVWARDIPLYRRAVPGHRHGGTPASCWFKPCPRRWLAWAAGQESADAGNPPVAYQPSMMGRRLKPRFT